ncbi:MAG TPA: hypothetical protein VEI07_01405 [Planctomycetaceae bacterium]|nr:hypothetical protein [Planctomycetaceae bacterium]
MKRGQWCVDPAFGVAATIGTWRTYYHMRRTAPVLVAAVVVSIAAGALIVVAILRS